MGIKEIIKDIVDLKNKGELTKFEKEQQQARECQSFQAQIPERNRLISEECCRILDILEISKNINIINSEILKGKGTVQRGSKIYEEERTRFAGMSSDDYCTYDKYNVFVVNDIIRLTWGNENEKFIEVKVESNLCKDNYLEPSDRDFSFEYEIKGNKNFEVGDDRVKSFIRGRLVKKNNKSYLESERRQLVKGLEDVLGKQYCLSEGTISV